MAVYSPPTEDLPIFDSTVFLTGDEPLTYNEAKKKFLRYPNAQGTENLQAIVVNGTSQFNQKATMSSSTNNTMLEISKTSGYSNSGLIIKNTGIDQSQSTNVNFINSLGQINLLQNKDLNINGGKTYMWEQNGTGNYLSQYVNATDYKWDTNIGGTVYNVLDLNTTTGLNIASKTNFTNTNIGSLTSSATQPIASDSSTKIPTTAWVQSAISAYTPPLPANVQFNSVIIAPIATVYNSGTSFLNNIYNLGATTGFSGSGTQAYSGGGWTPSIIPSIQFRTNDFSNTWNMNDAVLFRLDFFYWSGGSYGETSCKILLFPAAIKSNWGTSSLGTTTSYNINNKINNNASFVYTDATYAPYGRQYWTFDQNFSGVAGANAYLQGSNISQGIFQVSIWPQLFNNTTSWSWNLTCLNSNAAQTSPAEPMGVVLTYS